MNLSIREERMGVMKRCEMAGKRVVYKDEIEVLNFGEEASGVCTRHVKPGATDPSTPQPRGRS